MAKNDLHVALDVLARRPFDGMVILDAAEADALQQLIVDMHDAHAGTQAHRDELETAYKEGHQRLMRATRAMESARSSLTGYLFDNWAQRRT